MVYQPRDTDTVYESLRSRLSGRIEKLTNFVETSFNYVWTHDVFAEQLHEYEVALLATQLSGWVEYAGRELEEKDLEDLGVNTDYVSADEINKYMEDSDLDELAKIVGVERFPGDHATGQVTFTVSSDSVTVPQGTSVATEPGSDGEFYEFTTTEDVSPDTGNTTVTAPIEATEIGEEYNVGSGTIVYLPNPPAGVTDVVNNDSTSGGEDRQGNESLRDDIKRSINESSEGGTTAGIEGYIQNNVQGTDVYIEEFTSASPPYVDVIVDGGGETEVQDAIDNSRPVGIKHNLVRPAKYTVNITANIVGSGFDTSVIEDRYQRYLEDLNMNQNVVRDQIVLRSLRDNTAEYVKSLDIEIYQEPHTYQSGTTQYSLNKQMVTDGINNVTDANGNSYTEGTDFEEVDTDGDGSVDGIDWGIGGSSPSDGVEFYVTYDVKGDMQIASREVAIPGTMSVTEVSG